MLLHVPPHPDTVIQQLTRERDRLRAALLAAKIPHQVVDEDPWYSCPASGRSIRHEAETGNECWCGADAHNARIDAALAGEQKQ